MSILSHNGSALIAMAGDGCVAIASDRRFGVNLQTISTDFERIFQINSNIFIGLSGLGTDVQTLIQRFRFRHKLFQLREERDMPPKLFSSFVSSLLYEKRFGPYFIEPLIAGLDENAKPYLCTMDLIGCKQESDDFIVGGTATDSLFGACESLYRPNMNPDELFETISQALISSFDRDALSGWGGIVYVITKDQIVTKTLKGRMD